MNTKKVLKFLVYIFALIGASAFFSNIGLSLLGIVIGLVLTAILLRLIQALFTKEPVKDTSIPVISVAKEKHYQETGMSEAQIKFFRETMAYAKKQIVQLEKNMQSVAKLKAIDLRNDTLKAAKGMFKELVKEPQKLHQADAFLYNHLPNLVDLTNKYLEINEHDIKTKNTYEALNKSAAVIDQVSQLLASDYEQFVSDDLEALDVEITLAEQNLARQRSKAEYQAAKNQEEEF